MTHTFAGHYDADTFRPTFLRSLASEFLKINTRAMKVTAAIGLVFYGLVVWAIANPTFGGLRGPGVLLIFWEFMTIFFIIMGALAVTSEYSHNTMRTTALSDPQRIRAFFAKILAVTISTTLLSTLLLGLGLAIATMRLPHFTPMSEGTRPYLMFLALMVIVAVMATSMGYMLRSTAGAISIMMAFIFFSSLITLIPRKFFQETLAQFTPAALGNLAVSGENMRPGADLIVTSPGIAIAVFAGYGLIFLLAGLALYKSRDI